jgi:hypothetical protein
MAGKVAAQGQARGSHLHLVGESGFMFASSPKESEQEEEEAREP